MQNTRIIALASPRFVLPAGLTNIFVSSLASFFALARFAFSRASSASWSARFTCTGIMAHWTAGRALVLVDGVPPADWRPFFCGPPKITKTSLPNLEVLVGLIQGEASKPRFLSVHHRSADRSARAELVEARRQAV